MGLAGSMGGRRMGAKHAFDTDCGCDRCSREARRREAQREDAGPIGFAVKHAHHRGRRGRIARELWDAYESGRPMSDDDR